MKLNDNLYMMSYMKYKVLGTVASVFFAVTSCTEMYDLPEDKDFISENLNYTNKVLEPRLGITTIMNPLNADNSTLPIGFEIINPRFGDGRPVTDFLQVVPTYEWIAEYDGEETSLQEIENKRHLVDKPLFEVDAGGRFIMHATATNELVTPRPADTVLKTQDIRFFDLKLSNSGGIRYVKDFQLIPWREIPYEPSTDINPYTGGIAPDPNAPNDPRKRAYIVPSFISNIVGETTNVLLENNIQKKDIVVYIRPFEGGNGNKLRFKFLNKDSIPIYPLDFNETRWDELVHGFNKEVTAEYVQYDVAYPIPLTSIRTIYSIGDRVQAEFGYSRIGWGGTREIASFGLNFKIFKKGDWEIVFHFKNDNPKFDNE
ncbi:DUF5007 domain-containing protein [Sphingobacterium alkalisoli]|nr:DUF5007 domain-containing protein [Sphingobacterium alkalisoli]